MTRGANPRFMASTTLLLRDLTRATSHCEDIAESGQCAQECRLGYRPISNIDAQWTCVFDFMRYEQKGFDT
jgi:hypothetical protein